MDKKEYLSKINMEIYERAVKDAQRNIDNRIRNIINDIEENFDKIDVFELTDEDDKLLSYSGEELFNLDNLENYKKSFYKSMYNNYINSSKDFNSIKNSAKILGIETVKNDLKEKGNVKEILPVIASNGSSFSEQVKYYYALGYNEYRYTKIKQKAVEDKIKDDSVTIVYSSESLAVDKLREAIIVSLLGEKPELDSTYDDIYKYFSEVEEKKFEIDKCFDEHLSGISYGISLGSTKALHKQIEIRNIPSYISAIPEEVITSQNISNSKWFNIGLNEGFVNGWNDYVKSAYQALKNPSDGELVKGEEEIVFEEFIEEDEEKNTIPNISKSELKKSILDAYSELLEKENIIEDSITTTEVPLEEVPEDVIVSSVEEGYHHKK